MNNDFNYMSNNVPPQRVLAIHDLSAFGRCALTVIMPVLSAMGHQCVPLPTALLSTHTGGFENLYFLDLTDSIEPIAEHFERLGLEFDAIYTGFLGSKNQIGIVSSIIDRFCKDKTKVLVDPVMGDDGVLYSTYNDTLVQGMRLLCQKAHFITPNLTEAAFLTGMPCLDTKSMSKDQLCEYVSELIAKLSALCKGSVVITGIVFGDRMLSVYYDGNSTAYHSNTLLPISYPGTGDIFASVTLGSLLAGQSFSDSVVRACDFTAQCIEYTVPLGNPVREGVALEKVVSYLSDDK